VLSANRHASKSDHTRRQRSVRNAAFRTIRFRKSLDEGAAFDEPIHDNNLRSRDFLWSSVNVAGRRRALLEQAVAAIFEEDFVERILPFDSAAARAFAPIAARRRGLGRPISEFDAQIEAIAHSRGATLATRNVGDFANCGIKVISPWE
jgi:predicted nucleic acid-binding protein